MSSSTTAAAYNDYNGRSSSSSKSRSNYYNQQFQSVSTPSSPLLTRAPSVRSNTHLPPAFNRHAVMQSDDLSSLICPICNSQQRSIEDLNLHIDSLHIEDGPTLDSFKNWFSGKLPDFVKNTSQKVVRTLVQDMEPEPDDGITRQHWQSDSETNTCNSLGCERVLGIRSGKVHCRRCGRLFCDAHCQRQMRLNQEAKHDPEQGKWVRVCKDCFQAKDGFLDLEGKERSWDKLFLKHRRKYVDKADLATNRLEKRLDKLTRIYAGEVENFKPGLFTMRRSQWLRSCEQQVVMWEDDTNVNACRICTQNFTAFSNRKHHCRLCGTVVCHNLETQCSLEMELIRGITSEVYEKGVEYLKLVGRILVCSTCYRSVTIKRQREMDKLTVPLIFNLYSAMARIRDVVDRTLPKFNDMVENLEEGNSIRDQLSEEHPDYRHAAQIRKTLVDSFTHFDQLSKKIGSLTPNNRTERRLQGSIQAAANQYLQDHMLKLARLPKITRTSLSSPAMAPIRLSPSMGQSSSRKTSMVESAPASPTPTPDPSSSSTPSAAPPTSTPSVRSKTLGTASPFLIVDNLMQQTSADDRAKQLRDDLRAFRDQYSQVQQFLEQASLDKKAEHIETLKQHLEELTKEIERIRTELKQTNDDMLGFGFGMDIGLGFDNIE